MIFAALYLKHRKATKSNVTIYNLFIQSFTDQSLYGLFFIGYDWKKYTLENDLRISECLKIR